MTSGGRLLGIARRDKSRAPMEELSAASITVEDGVTGDHRGKRLQIGAAMLEITGETDPCSRMDEQMNGLRDALKPHWRGGVTCRVLTGGGIAIGDHISLT